MDEMTLAERCKAHAMMVLKARFAYVEQISEKVAELVERDGACSFAQCLEIAQKCESRINESALIDTFRVLNFCSRSNGPLKVTFVDRRGVEMREGEALQRIAMAGTGLMRGQGGLETMTITVKRAPQ